MLRKIVVVVALFLICISGCASNAKKFNNTARFAEPKPALPDSAAFTDGFPGETTYTDKSMIADASTIKDKPYDGNRYLVPAESYTTAAINYHTKYKESLLSIAEELTNKNIKIGEKTLGFYYDKNANDKNSFYVGLDSILPRATGSDYLSRAKAVIYTSLKPVLETVNSREEIFSESNVAGMAIGFKWRNAGASEQVSIWIPKYEALSYRGDSMPFEELVYRSFLTNAIGRIIVLPRK